MYDSITAIDVPAGSELVAGYVDGRYKWSDADWALFPDNIKVRIAVDPNTRDGHVLDVENGAASPADVPFWLTHRRAAGVDPSVYVNLSNVSAVAQACAAAGIIPPWLWLAHYDGVAQIPPSYVAKQYANAAMTGGHYDASVVADFWPGVDEMTPAEVQALIDASIAAYGQRLQAELDANYAAKQHPHTATATTSIPAPTTVVTIA